MATRSVGDEFERLNASLRAGGKMVTLLCVVLAISLVLNVFLLILFFAYTKI